MGIETSASDGEEAIEKVKGPLFHCVRTDNGVRTMDKELPLWSYTLHNT